MSRLIVSRSPLIPACGSTPTLIPLPGRNTRVEHNDRRQLDAARQQVGRVKARARPWRSIITLVLAAIMAGVSRSARADTASVFFRQTPFGALGRTTTEILADLASLAFCLLAYAATAGLAGRAREVLQPKIGTAHAALVRYAIVLLGGLATILITLALFGTGLTLLVGGAFATVLISIAAQQSLSNLFAGIFLVLARPVHVGDRVSIRSGALGGEFCGDVTEIGITFITLDTSDGPQPPRWRKWWLDRACWLAGRGGCKRQRHRHIARDGAILVRPDRFIAWRHPAGSDEPRAVLTPRSARSSPGRRVGWPVRHGLGLFLSDLRQVGLPA